MKRFFLVLCVLFLISANDPDTFKNRISGNFQYLLHLVPQEKLYLHTDKNAYMVGEDIWFRGYLVNAIHHMPRHYSRFIYTELVDRRDSVIQRVKWSQTDSVFHGNITLPSELQQGEYVLRAYSYFMQNDGEDFLFKKKIRVINPQDSKVVSNLTYTINKANDYTANIQLLNGSGEPYSRVTVSYLTNKSKYGEEPRLTRTDKDGNFTINIDSTTRFIDLSFHDSEPFSFQRYVYVPKQFQDYDVQFFPEGGSLLQDNRQTVAFKAIGADGRSINVSGMVFIDSTEIADVITLHDGMGKFMVPVNPGAKFTAKLVSEDGVEKIFDLPPVVDDQWSLSANIKDSELNYRVVKGVNAPTPDELYVVVQSRGLIYGIIPIPGPSRGNFSLDSIQEGVATISLIDGNMNVLSQRLFFVREKNRPDLSIKTNKSEYIARDWVELDIEFTEELRELEGRFSVSVTDDQKVELNPLEDNIISNLLLTSDLKGHIENPAYYFEEVTPEVDEHLDLVMMTHGWTRFDINEIIKGVGLPGDYPLELGQIVAGKVLTKFWGRNSKGAQIALISNSGHFATTQTDDEGNFVIDGLDFKDHTVFMIQALNDKGKKGVSVQIERDTFLTPQYSLPYNKLVKEKEDEFYKKFGMDYYYDDGIKVYVLDEVNVTKKIQKKSYSPYDHMARYSLDSAKIASLIPMDISFLVQELPGVMVEMIEVEEFGFKRFEERFTRNGNELYTLVNDFPEDMTYIKMIPMDALRSIVYLDPQDAMIFFGDTARNGALIISTDPFTPKKAIDPTHLVSFSLLGYQIPKEFYVPKYDIDSVRRDNRYDERSTIYWNPNVELKNGETAKVSFYTADTYGDYSVIIEGVTKNGIICRKRISLLLK